MYLYLFIVTAYNKLALGMYTRSLYIHTYVL